MRDAFERAMAADVWDDAPRLIYADWLDEHGYWLEAEQLRHPRTDWDGLPEGSRCGSVHCGGARAGGWMGHLSGAEGGWAGRFYGADGECACFMLREYRRGGCGGPMGAGGGWFLDVPEEDTTEDVLAQILAAQASYRPGDWMAP
jgi:uncharacterized protein (TIGR02996 family)